MEQLGTTGKRIVLVGDSAGGNLVFALALKVRMWGLHHSGLLFRSSRTQWALIIHSGFLYTVRSYILWALTIPISGLLYHTVGSYRT